MCKHLKLILLPCQWGNSFHHVLTLSEIEMILPFTNFPTMYGFSCLKQAGSVPSPPCWAALEWQSLPGNSSRKWRFSKGWGGKIRSLGGLLAPGVTDKTGQGRERQLSWKGPARAICSVAHPFGALAHPGMPSPGVPCFSSRLPFPVDTGLPCTELAISSAERCSELQTFWERFVLH